MYYYYSSLNFIKKSKIRCSFFRGTAHSAIKMMINTPYFCKDNVRMEEVERFYFFRIGTNSDSIFISSSLNLLFTMLPAPCIFPLLRSESAV